MDRLNSCCLETSQRNDPVAIWIVLTHPHSCANTEQVFRFLLTLEGKGPWVMKNSGIGKRDFIVGRWKRSS